MVLNPGKVDRNILIERYKLANQQKQALTAKLEDLKARHQNLTGDKTWYLIFLKMNFKRMHWVILTRKPNYEL